MGRMKAGWWPLPVVAMLATDPLAVIVQNSEPGYWQLLGGIASLRWGYQDPEWPVAIVLLAVMLNLDMKLSMSLSGGTWLDCVCGEGESLDHPQMHHSSLLHWWEVVCILLWVGHPPFSPTTTVLRSFWGHFFFICITFPHPFLFPMLFRLSCTATTGI